MGAAALMLLGLLAVLPARAASKQATANQAAPKQATTVSNMVGTWFGRGQPGDALSMYIDRMRADGRWRGEYRACRHGKALDQVQQGRWEMEGDRLLLHIQTVDGQAMARTDAYRMLAHDARAQRYIALPSGFAYTPRRVADDYRMPSCDLIS